jgi:hypothetical protein
MEGALNRLLGPQDFFSRVGECAYVVIFDQLQEPEASVKCSLIAKEVLQKLFGNNDDAKDVVIQTAVANVDGTIDLQSSNPLDIIAELLNAAPQHSIIHDAAVRDELDLHHIDLTTRRHAGTMEYLDKGQPDLEQMLRKTERGVDKWQVHLPAKGQIIFDPTVEKRLSPKDTAVDMTPPSMRGRPIISRPRQSPRFDDVQAVEFSYQSMWYAQKTAVVGYHCRVNFKTSTELIAAEEFVLDGSFSNASWTVDRLTLRKGLADLAALLASGGRALLIVPLHASSFALPNAWVQFEQALSGLTQEMRNLLMFEVVDASTLAPNFVTADMVRRLSRYARHVIARVPIYTLGLANYRQCGFTGCSASLNGLLHDEAEILRMVGQFTKAATDSKRLSIVVDVATKSVLLSAIASGAEYIGGTAISDDSLTLRAVAPLHLTDIYQKAESK